MYCINTISIYHLSLQFFSLAKPFLTQHQTSSTHKLTSLKINVATQTVSIRSPVLCLSTFNNFHLFSVYKMQSILFLWLWISSHVLPGMKVAVIIWPLGVSHKLWLLASVRETCLVFLTVIFLIIFFGWRNRHTMDGQYGLKILFQ